MSENEKLILFANAAKYLLLFSIILLAIRFIYNEVRLHRNNRSPVYTERATVHYKHPEKEMVYAGRGNHELFFITFHTDQGQQLKLYMTYEHFYILEEGDTGMLTWQGEKFWKFEPEK